MKVQLQKFGSILTSRDAGREAYDAFRPNLAGLEKDEPIEMDFSGIGTLSPSWADEFISRLQEEFKSRVVLLPTDNLSVQTTMKLLDSIHGRKS